MGLGLAHFAFVRSNAMLAFSGVFKFSVKDITLRAKLFLFLRVELLSHKKEAFFYCVSEPLFYKREE